MCLDITLIMDKKIEIQSAVFERLINHLQKESSVQNIDMMILSGFCRNCLSRWYQEEAEKMGEEINPDEANQMFLLRISDRAPWISLGSVTKISPN